MNYYLVLFNAAPSCSLFSHFFSNKQSKFSKTNHRKKIINNWNVFFQRLRPHFYHFLTIIYFFSLYFELNKSVFHSHTFWLDAKWFANTLKNCLSNQLSSAPIPFTKYFDAIFNLFFPLREIFEMGARRRFHFGAGMVTTKYRAVFWWLR